MAAIIVALDKPSRSEALAVVDALADLQEWYKVGLELYTREGPDIVRELVEREKSVFLDLKLHDIPQTVGRATAAARELGARMITLHVAGGRSMVASAREAAGEALLLLGVTVLTSLGPEDVSTAWGRKVSSVPSEVERLAKLASDWDLGGVVLSPQEASVIDKGASKLKIVTPGVRRESDVAGDQRRVATPAFATRAGADFLVIGRPVAGADDPRAALSSFEAEIADAKAA